MRKGLLLAGVLALGGCFEEAPKGEAVRGGDLASRATAAAEGKVREAARDRDGLRFRAVQTYRQAVADTYAVCGQATVAGDSVFIPFVSVVRTGGAAPEVEQHIGRTNMEATRVYVELVGRCFDGGGPVPRPGGATVAQATPPLPNGLPVLEAVTPEAPRAPEVAAAPAPAAAGTLVMRQNGNIRSSPGGGGAVLRVARAGTALTIFGTAPGGWYQVGDASPEGWVHGSVGAPQGSTVALAQ